MGDRARPRSRLIAGLRHVTHRPRALPAANSPAREVARPQPERRARASSRAQRRRGEVGHRRHDVRRRGPLARAPRVREHHVLERRTPHDRRTERVRRDRARRPLHSSAPPPARRVRGRHRRDDRARHRLDDVDLHRRRCRSLSLASLPARRSIDRRVARASGVEGHPRARQALGSRHVLASALSNLARGPDVVRRRRRLGDRTGHRRRPNRGRRSHSRQRQRVASSRAGNSRRARRVVHRARRSGRRRASRRREPRDLGRSLRERPRHRRPHRPSRRRAAHDRRRHAARLRPRSQRNDRRLLEGRGPRLRRSDGQKLVHVPGDRATEAERVARRGDRRVGAIVSSGVGGRRRPRERCRARDLARRPDARGSPSTSDSPRRGVPAAAHRVHQRRDAPHGRSREPRTGAAHSLGARRQPRAAPPPAFHREHTARRRRGNGGCGARILRDEAHRSLGARDDPRPRRRAGGSPRPGHRAGRRGGNRPALRPGPGAVVDAIESRCERGQVLRARARARAAQPRRV